MSLNLSGLGGPGGGNDSDNELLLEKFKKYNIFEGIDDKIILGMIKRSSETSFSDGDILINEGDESDGKSYLILSGKAVIIKGGLEIARLGEGDLFGEYAIICDEPRSATVMAEDGLTCLILNGIDLNELSRLNNTVSNVILKRYS